ncbi:ABC transporter permease [Oceanobacillus piezotolerans]|uniref:ABC transporter permease n=1 Tax=Oceanobacillus piezotolerans TaxID=2448030 RepID=A0A498D842_9BACI|nr:ABC transporter permease [Oceanobacillus piezotolerans]RLL43958.1 ABC transporter permease [Oceanobacillus piezotolerans]
MKRIIQLSSTWFPIWLISLLMFIMISIYLPVFGGGIQNLTNAPLIVANEDKGPAGDIILVNLIEKQNGSSFKWSVVDNKEEALHDLMNNKAYGALVIPEDFSKHISEINNLLINGNGIGEAATLEILLNEGIGQSASMIASRALETIVYAASSELSSNLKKELNQQDRSIPADQIALAEVPVRATTKNVLGIPVHLYNGMTPFVLILIASISGIMGTNMIHGYLLRGNGALKKEGVSLSGAEMLKTELLLIIILAFSVAAVSQLAVFGFFGSSHASSIWVIFLFSFFCSLTMLFLFKSLALLFGGWGMLVMFPVNIMGIFSSGGAVPLSTLPAIHHIFSLILPTRYMVDGMRALLYYGGRMQAGLGTALLAISSYFVVALMIIIAFIANEHRKGNAPKMERSVNKKTDKVQIQVSNRFDSKLPEE